MKNAPKGQQRRAASPYAKYDKHEVSYSAMYQRAPHLRRKGSERAGEFAPDVRNPFYRKPQPASYDWLADIEEIG